MHKAVSNLPLPEVCEEMLIIPDYEIYFFLRVPEITLFAKEAINPQSILPFGLDSR